MLHVTHLLSRKVYVIVRNFAPWTSHRRSCELVGSHFVTLIVHRIRRSTRITIRLFIQSPSTVLKIMKFGVTPSGLTTPSMSMSSLGAIEFWQTGFYDLIFSRPTATVYRLRKSNHKKMSYYNSRYVYSIMRFASCCWKQAIETIISRSSYSTVFHSSRRGLR